MTHFTDLELHRWRESGVGTDRERAIRHAAECATCATRYAAAIRDGALDAVRPADDVADFVATGLAYARPIRPRRQQLLWWITSAAAAIVIVGVGVGVSRMRTPEAPAPDPTTLRGALLDPRAPSGAVDASGLQFVWSAGVAAARFRIDIGDTTDVVFSGDATRSPWTPPADAARRLRPGVDYWWTVTALDAAGAPATTSPRRSFAIAPPR